MIKNKYHSDWPLSKYFWRLSLIAERLEKPAIYNVLWNYACTFRNKINVLLMISKEARIDLILSIKHKFDVGMHTYYYLLWSMDHMTNHDCDLLLSLATPRLAKKSFILSKYMLSGISGKSHFTYYLFCPRMFQSAKYKGQYHIYFFLFDYKGIICCFPLPNVIFRKATLLWLDILVKL